MLFAGNKVNFTNYIKSFKNLRTNTDVLQKMVMYDLKNVPSVYTNFN